MSNPVGQRRARIIGESTENFMVFGYRKDSVLKPIFFRELITRDTTEGRFVRPLTSVSRYIDLISMIPIILQTVINRPLLCVDRRAIVIESAGFRGSERHDHLTLRIHHVVIHRHRAGVIREQTTRIDLHFLLHGQGFNKNVLAHAHHILR
jgi:hypothetical protein